MSIVTAILVFGLIILIHEFGHFLFAKLSGIGVVEFSIGMGPRLLSFVKGGTRYSIKVLPFGGSCMMLGEDEDDSDPKAFQNKPVWARIAVVAAGPVFNFILAFILGVIIVRATGYDSPQLVGVQEGFPAQEQGLRAGDIITRMNRERVVVYRDITLYMMLHPGETVKVEYIRPPQTEADGKKTAEEKRTAVITPKYSEETGTYMLGIMVNSSYQPVKGLGETLKYGAYEVLYVMKMTIRSIAMIFRGQVGMRDMAGPVRLVSIIDETVEETLPYGWETVLLTLASLSVLLSANLGVMNLLPIPALDGGRLVFLLIEALTGKPVDREKEGMVHMAGMVFLMGLMLLVLFNDITILLFG